MRKQVLSVAVGVLSLPVLGGLAYGAAHSVGDSPAPQRIIPASSVSRGGGADDPANHDANDDRGGANRNGTTSTTITARAVRSGGADDPASHDLNDDNPNRGSTTSTTSTTSTSASGPSPTSTSSTSTTSTSVRGDDGPRHDIGDDKGGLRGSTSTTDDSGSSSGRGRGRSGGSDGS
jgi:hypothetical protein